MTYRYKLLLIFYMSVTSGCSSGDRSFLISKIDFFSKEYTDKTSSAESLLQSGYEELNDEQFKLAERDFARALDLSPEDEATLASAHLGLGLARLRGGKPAIAAESFEAAVQTGGDAPIKFGIGFPDDLVKTREISIAAVAESYLGMESPDEADDLVRIKVR